MTRSLPLTLCPALLCVVLLGGLASGCATSPELKDASTRFGTSLEALQSAQEDFQGLFLRELHVTRELVGQAIVAAAVKRRVEALSQAELDGDLFAISDALSNERQTYRNLADRLIAAVPTEAEARADDGAEAMAERVLITEPAAGLRGAASNFDTIDPERAADLRQQADVLEARENPLEDFFDDFVTLARLRLTMDDVTAGVADLEATITFMQDIHEQIQTWIHTDVTVDGGALASLVDEHAEVLGAGGDS